MFFQRNSLLSATIPGTLFQFRVFMMVNSQTLALASVREACRSSDVLCDLSGYCTVIFERMTLPGEGDHSVNSRNCCLKKSTRNKNCCYKQSNKDMATFRVRSFWSKFRQFILRGLNLRHSNQNSLTLMDMWICKSEIWLLFSTKT